MSMVYLLLQIIILHVLQMFASCETCLRHVLWFVLFVTHIYYTLYSPPVLLVSILYSSRSLLMFSSLLLYCFLKDTLLIPHSLQVYIVVDTVLYIYALLIDHFSYPFLSLCLCCNLSQAQDYNIYLMMYTWCHEHGH